MINSTSFPDFTPGKNTDTTVLGDDLLKGFDEGVIGDPRPLGFQFDTTFATVAKTWTNLGFNVIPGNREDKTPLVTFKFWSGEDAHAVPDEILADWAETHRDATPLLLLDSGRTFRLTVVDADDPRMSRWIENVFGKTPFVVTTGREGGGAHYYYRTPGNAQVQGRNKVIGPDDGVLSWDFAVDPQTGRVSKHKDWGKTAVDLKSRRNYVVAPGALHKSGRRYLARVDLDTVDSDWFLTQVPEFDVARYEDQVRQAAERKSQKLTEIDAEVRRRFPDGVPTPAPTATMTATSHCTTEPFLAWCRDNPGEVNLELWWGLATNIAAVQGAAGRDLFHEISRLAPDKYDEQECDYNWGRALNVVESKTHGPTTYETLQMHGYTGDVPTGFKAPAAFLRSQQRPKFLRHAKGPWAGQPHNDRVENTKALLEFGRVSVCSNEMTKQTEYTFPDEIRRTANDAEAEIRELGRKYGYRPSRDVFDEHVRIVRREASYHPVADWVGSKPWDGTDRLPALMASLRLVPGSDAGLAQILLRRWLLSAAAALANPHGVKAEGVLVLVGPQGTGKTRWIASLAPVGVEIGMSLDPSNKDSVLGCIRSWIVELGELDATFRKADLARLKAFLSQTIDLIRVPYARREDEFPRRTVFAASVNDSAFLKDMTGNRRYWTIPVESCDPGHGIDVQQLWAQMLALHRSGERHWLDSAESSRLNSINEEHTETDPMEDALAAYFKPDPNTWTTQRSIRHAVEDEFSGWSQRDARAMTIVLRRWADKLGLKPRKSCGDRLWPVQRISVGGGGTAGGNIDDVEDLFG